jgi:hypothetical protein
VRIDEALVTAALYLDARDLKSAWSVRNNRLRLADFGAVQRCRVSGRMNAGDMFVTQSLPFRHMTRRASRFIERQIHEHNHSEEAAAQSDAKHDGQHDRQASIQAIIGSEVIPPVKPELFCERKEFGICDRSAAFRPEVEA